jgi:dTDP-4-amino-4,6-dideoxygalactose transaminase
MKQSLNRRRFLGTTAAATAATAVLPPLARADDAKPAKLGGTPVRSTPFPSWPMQDRTEDKALLEALHSGHWFRSTGTKVVEFEAAYAKLTGSKHCLATSSGTASLATVLGALDIGPGDEVIVPPYTFIATFNAVTLNHALPVLVDTDLDSFQIDPAKVPAAINADTRALLPVHIGGSPADLDALLAAAKPRGIPVIEDACQAHLAEWRGRSVGTWGFAGCFSFQASKNLNSGEGGAVLTQDSDFADACYAFHYQGRGRMPGSTGKGAQCARGTNLRLSEFQAALLQAQMTRVVEQSRHRTENADYLTRLLREIPGITPARLPEGATRSAYHLYMFRYDPAAFQGLERGRFLSALGAEGISASSGYGPMTHDAYVRDLAKNRHYLKIYGEARMKRWLEHLECPQNDRLCKEAVWFSQTQLLGPRSDMDQIAEAIRKIRAHGAELAKA